MNVVSVGDGWFAPHTSLPTLDPYSAQESCCLFSELPTLLQLSAMGTSGKGMRFLSGNTDSQEERCLPNSQMANLYISYLSLSVSVEVKRKFSGLENHKNSHHSQPFTGNYWKIILTKMKQCCVAGEDTRKWNSTETRPGLQGIGSEIMCGKRQYFNTRQGLHLVPPPEAAEPGEVRPHERREAVSQQCSGM